jgi:hypothetical protein
VADEGRRGEMITYSPKKTADERSASRANEITKAVQVSMAFD